MFPPFQCASQRAACLTRVPPYPRLCVDYCLDILAVPSSSDRPPQKMAAVSVGLPGQASCIDVPQLGHRCRGFPASDAPSRQSPSQALDWPIFCAEPWLCCKNWAQQPGQVCGAVSAFHSLEVAVAAGEGRLAAVPRWGCPATAVGSARWRVVLVYSTEPIKADVSPLYRPSRNLESP
jgi:hypothetical protein